MIEGYPCVTLEVDDEDCPFGFWQRYHPIPLQKGDKVKGYDSETKKSYEFEVIQITYLQENNKSDNKVREFITYHLKWTNKSQPTKSRKGKK